MGCIQSYENNNRRLLAAFPKLRANIISENIWLNGLMPQTSKITDQQLINSNMLLLLDKYEPLIPTDWKHNWENDLITEGGVSFWFNTIHDAMYPKCCSGLLHICCCISC